MTRAPETKKSGKNGDGQTDTGDLASRIRMAQADWADKRSSGQGRQQDFSKASRGFRLAAEFVSAIVVGAALGFGIDTVAGTTPWLSIIFLLLGFAAGVLNVIRAANEMAAEAPPSDDTGTVPFDDEDEEDD